MIASGRMPRASCAIAPRARQPQVRRPERRRHRHPAHARRPRSAAARRDERRHVVPERREPFRHRRDVHRSPLVPGRSGRWRSRGSSSGIGGRGSEIGSDPGFVRSSSAKNGPDSTWPKSSRSSFIAAVSTRSTARVGPLSRHALLAFGPRDLQRLFVATWHLGASHAPAPSAPLAPFAPLARSREPLLSEPHEDVLDEPADERRVVADPLDAEAGVGGDAAQLAGCRRAGSGDPTCAAVPGACRSVPTRSSRRARALIQRRPDGDRRVLPDVRVDEQLAARRDHARRLGQHAAQRLRRQVFEDVERVRLRERRRRRTAAAADRRAAGRPRARDSCAKNGLMSIPTAVRPPVAVPQQRAAAAAAEIDDAIAGARREELAQHVVADLRAEQRRRHALVPRVGVQRLVQVLRLLLERLVRPQVEEVLRRPAVLPAARGRSAPTARRRASVARRAPHERQQSVRNHRAPRLASVRRTAPRAVRRGAPR